MQSRDLWEYGGKTLAILALLISNASSAAIPPPPLPLFLDKPFHSASAIARLTKLLKPVMGRDFTQNEINDLGNITRISYSFSPPFKGPEPNRPKAQKTILTRVIETDISRHLSAGALFQSISSGLQENCEQHSELSGVQFEISDVHHVAVRGHMKHSEWWCGRFLFWDYKTLKGSGSADFAMQFMLNQDLTPSSVGDPKISNEHIDHQSWWDFLGVLDPSMIPISKVVEKAVNDAVRGAISDAAQTIGALGTNRQFDALVSGLSSLTQYTSALDKSQEIYSDPKTIYEQTGFVVGSDASPMFMFTQMDTLEGSNANREYQKRTGEIAFLAGLPFDKPEEYTVRKGEILWKLVSSRYPDPRIYLLIEDSNELRDKQLRPGKVLMFPRLWQVYARVQEMPTLISPGDTLVALRKRRGGHLKVTSRQLRSHDLNLIYPYESVH